MARTVTLSEFHRKILKLVPELEGAVVRGLKSSALRLEGLVTEEIDTAKPFPAVDRGELRQSVGHEFFEDGAEVAVSAPHAAHIEHGTRPHWPPFQPILEWAQRKGISEDPYGFAKAVQKKISEEGIAPRHYFKKAWDRVQPVIGQEIDRELAALAAKG
jgi:hypothetical protein